MANTVLEAIGIVSLSMSAGIGLLITVNVIIDKVLKHYSNKRIEIKRKEAETIYTITEKIRYSHHNSRRDLIKARNEIDRILARIE